MNVNNMVEVIKDSLIVDKLTVDRIMTKHVIRITPDATIKEASILMTRNSIGSAIVTKRGKDIGILTERDLVFKACPKSLDMDRVKVREIMSSPILSIKSNISIIKASHLMNLHHIKRICVEKNGKVIGIVSIKDVLKRIFLINVINIKKGKSIQSNTHNMTVGDMSTRNIVKIFKNETIKTASIIMKRLKIGSLIVRDEDNDIGIITERDILNKVCAAGLDPSKTTVKIAMTNPVITIPESTTLIQAILLMAAKKVRRLVISDGSKITGLVSLRDIIKISYKEFLKAEKYLHSGAHTKAVLVTSNNPNTEIGLVMVAIDALKFRRD